MTFDRWGRTLFHCRILELRNYIVVLGLGYPYSGVRIQYDGRLLRARY